VAIVNPGEREAMGGHAPRMTIAPPTIADLQPRGVATAWVRCGDPFEQ